MGRSKKGIRLTRQLAEDLVEASVFGETRYTAPPFTFFGVCARLLGEQYQGAGTAVCRADDEWDTGEGRGIARKRAIRAIVKQVMIDHRYLTLEDAAMIMTTLGPRAPQGFGELCRNTFDPYSIWTPSILSGFSIGVRHTPSYAPNSVKRGARHISVNEGHS